MARCGSSKLNKIITSGVSTMLKQAKLLALLIATSLTGGCFDDDDDNSNAERDPIPVEKTYVVFSPATSETPIPNDLLFSSEPLADGTMYAGNDPSNPVITGIDFLDGSSVIAPLDIKFSGPLDDSQSLDANSFIAVDGAVIPNPNQNVFLLPLSYPSGDPLQQAKVNGVAVEVPTFSAAAAYQTAVSTGDITTLQALAVPSVRAELLSLDGDFNNVIRISPLKPLEPETKYLVVLTQISDRNGNQVYPSIAYDYIKNPESNLGDLGLDALRGAIQGWERLAAGYFSFKDAVYTAAGISAAAPASEDIVLALTFTTGGTDSVLKSLIAPETFFAKSLTTTLKQDAIAKLVDGTYNLQADAGNLSSATDIAINTTLYALLTTPTFGTAPNPLYNASIATAIDGGANYTTIAQDATAAHLMQRAAAEAAYQVHNSGSAAMGDIPPYVDIKTEAQGTVAALAQGAQVAPSQLFPIPSPRTTGFYRVDLASSVNAALAAPALVYQGQITLPLYQKPPSEMDGTNIVNARWQADANGVGALIDIARGNEMGTTPPSSMVTYRYPFPAKQAEVTVPLLATLPEPTTLANFGINKPENGWPVIIFQHGITSDRSTALPMADALAFACVKPDLSGPSGAPCFATVAIDQPLHGVAAGGSRVPGLTSVSAPEPNFAANLPVAPSTELTERHYNFTANAANMPIPMDYAAEFGESGSLFVNLANFANARDSLRQASLDLLNLNASLATMDVDGDGVANDLDTSRVYFIGHSLGAIDGLPFVALNNAAEIQDSPFNGLPRIQAASAMFAGSGYTRLLANSPSFAPVIMPGLAQASDELVQGKSGLEAYLNIFQGVMDSADPINYAGYLNAAAGTTGILFSEIVGDGTPNHLSDRVIPNAADAIWGAENGPLLAVLDGGFAIDGFPAPLSGSEPLIDSFGASKSAEVSASVAPAVLITRYTEGSHLTPIVGSNVEIDPTTSGAVFYELLHQTTIFFATNGAPSGSIVDNSDIIED